MILDVTRQYQKIRSLTWTAGHVSIASMNISPRDRLLIAGAFLLLLLSSLYVPLVDCSYEGGVCLNGGYTWLWKVGSSDAPFYSIAKFRLFVEWVALGAVLGIAWLYTRERASD